MVAGPIELLFGGALNQFLLLAIIITALGVLYFATFKKLADFIPFIGPKINNLVGTIVIATWVLYFGRNILVNMWEDPTLKWVLIGSIFVGGYLYYQYLDSVGEKKRGNQSIF